MGCAIWAAVGAALTAIVGVVVFRESLSAPAVAGIVLIVLGVVLIEIGQAHQP